MAAGQHGQRGIPVARNVETALSKERVCVIILNHLTEGYSVRDGTWTREVVT